MKKLFLTFLIVLGLFPASAAAQTTVPFEISAWIPYWRDERGVNNILPHLDSFTEVNPFFYTVTIGGEVYPNGSPTDAEWARLKAEAKAKNVDFIPTVMWANADAMHEVLSDPEKRQAHIRSIAREVYAHQVDGIDIDYEAKYAKTRDAFSQFIKELEEAIGYDKLIMCTMESRTPLDSRYDSPDKIPADIEYANDFKEIAKYCDRVRLMTYDQMRIDLKLNKANSHPYIPVSDVAWVRKVVELLAQEIPKEKLVIGVPTYGYEYDLYQTAEGETGYSRLWSFNPGHALETASKLNITPTRNSAGELMITFPASQTPDVPPIIPLPNATRVMTWSDAEAIKQKFELAKELGVRGVAIFKIDDGQDPKLWEVLPQYRNLTVAVSGTTAGGATNNGGGVATPPPGSSGGGTESIPLIDLESGMNREEVRSLQKLLNKIGFTVASAGPGSVGNETTFFGAGTRGALIRYQKARGITPSVGYFGPITRAKIQKEA